MNFDIGDRVQWMHATVYDSEGYGTVVDIETRLVVRLDDGRRVVLVPEFVDLVTKVGSNT